MKHWENSKFHYAYHFTLVGVALNVHDEVGLAVEYHTHLVRQEVGLLVALINPVLHTTNVVSSPDPSFSAHRRRRSGSKLDTQLLARSLRS